MNRPPKAKCGPAFVGHPIHSSTPKTSATAEAGSKKGQSYKPLPTQFRHGEFDYRQIYREGDFAIYKQTWKGNEHSAAFEVIHIRRHEGFEIGGRIIEPAEIYPTAEAWGVDGWTVQDKGAAFRKLRELCASVERCTILTKKKRASSKKSPT